MTEQDVRSIGNKVLARRSAETASTSGVAKEESTLFDWLAAKAKAWKQTARDAESNLDALQSQLEGVEVEEAGMGGAVKFLLHVLAIVVASDIFNDVLEKAKPLIDWDGGGDTPLIAYDAPRMDVDTMAVLRIFSARGMRGEDLRVLLQGFKKLLERPQLAVNFDEAVRFYNN